MKLLTFSVPALCVFLLFSGCSTRPVNHHPQSRGVPPKVQNRTIIKKEPVKVVTETVVAAQPVTPTPPPVEVVPNPPPIVAPSLATDPLGVLRTPGLSKKAVEDILLNRLTTSQLESVLQDQNFLNYRPIILWQLGQLYQKSKRPGQALEYYRALAAQHPQHSLVPQANTMIAVLQATQEVNAKVIGALLPLTGRNANVGQHALNALRVALKTSQPDARFRLALYDTQSLPEKATAGVDKLLTEDKAIALIGGLSAKEATLIAQRAELFSVPFVALSQKPGLTNVGDYIFRNSLTPEMQVDQLLNYAFEKLGAKKFAILFPNDSYGVEFSNTFWDQVLARGGQITAAQTYDPKENDFTGLIQKMVGTYYPEARPEEYKERLDEMRKSKRDRNRKNKDKPVVKNSREHEVEEAVLPPIVDFDVLFVPDSGKILGQVMAFMKVNDVSGLTYLGTNIWNSPDLAKRAPSQKDRVFFVDALDPADMGFRNHPFFKEYFAEFNEEPTLIEMQVYESALILRDQINAGGTSRDSLASRLRIMGRSSGVTGELRMSNQREIERPIHILSLDSGMIRKVN